MKSTNGQFPIDLNHDGIIDFLIIDQGLYKTSNATSRSFGGQYLNVMRNGNVGAGVIGKPGETTALEADALIGRADPFLNAQSAGSLMASAFNDNNSFSNIHGEFANTKKPFLGLKFEIQHKTHYGWDRFAFVKAGFPGVPHVTPVVTGYAYETIPNRPIDAGQATGPDETSSIGGQEHVALSATNPRSAMLGLLAMGWIGLSTWRRQGVGRGYARKRLTSRPMLRIIDACLPRYGIWAQTRYHRFRPVGRCSRDSRLMLVPVP